MATIVPGSTAKLMRSRMSRAGRDPSARSTTRSVMASGGGRRFAASAAPESGIDDADLAHEPGLRIGPRTDFEPPRDHDRFSASDHRRGALEIDDDDVCRPVGIGLAERAERQGLARQHEEPAL